MKKKIAILLCIGILVFLTAAGALVAGQRPDSLRRDAVCRGLGGALYAAQNQEEGYTVYEINSAGAVQKAYTQQNWFGGRNSHVIALCFDGELYVLAGEEKEGGDSQFWIRKLSAGLTAEETAYPLFLEEQRPLTLYKEEGQLLLDTVSGDYKTESVYQLELPETQGLSCRLLLRSRGDYEPKKDGQEELMRKNEPLYCSPGVRMLLVQSAMVRAAVMICLAEAAAGLLILAGMGRRGWIIQGFLLLYLVFLGSMYVQSRCPDRLEALCTVFEPAGFDPENRVPAEETKRWILLAAGTGLLWGICFFIYRGTDRAMRRMEEHILQKSKKSLYVGRLLYRTCRRFAPQGMEKLIGKRSLLELASGDYADRRMTCVLLYSKKEKGLTSFDYLKQCAQEMITIRQMMQYRQSGQSGILLANGDSLEQWRILFPEPEGDVVSFAAETLSLLHPADGLMVLFKDYCVCGIAGSQNQAFPVFLSWQADLLEGYQEAFQKAGLGLVLTQDIAKSVEDERRVRYIGFVRDKETGNEVRIYESLDVYEEELRVSRLKTGAAFDRALELYYQNDFYLARNEFSGVLKECAQDGVAKWYLFQCEKQLDARTQDEISHALFDGWS